MHVRNAVCRVCLLLAFLGLSAGSAGGGSAQHTDVEQINEKVDRLTDLILQMQTDHADEINALKKEIAQLRAGKGANEPAEETDELAALRGLALEQAGGEEQPDKTPEETVFKAAGLSLQKLNPEISASGDFLTYYRKQNDTRKRTDAEIRGLELNIQSYLDPFSYMKATAHISDEGVDVEEVYFTRFSAVAGANLDVGRFRQQFGVVNRWHEDALDQVHYPLALQRIFGDEGLNQTGASLDWTLPT
jgi:hypothetical protein